MSNKLPSHLENPIDDTLLKIGAWLLPHLHATGHTPNLITTYSFVLGIASVYQLHCDRLYWFAICHVLSYFFDCVDGQMARTYKMTSKFGDLYDHATDLLVSFMLLYVVYKKYSRHFSPVLIACTAGMACLSAMHLGCQQKHYASNKESGKEESLDRLTKLCTRPESIAWTRYFGTGTFMVFAMLLIIYLHHQN